MIGVWVALLVVGMLLGLLAVALERTRLSDDFLALVAALGFVCVGTAIIVLATLTAP